MKKIPGYIQNIFFFQIAILENSVTPLSVKVFGVKQLKKNFKEYCKQKVINDKKNAMAKFYL